MTLQQLRYVTAIAETGTLSEAARRFYIAQPSLTASLRELEEEGLVIRKEYMEVPIRVEYSTTALCDRLMPILESLSDWGEALMKERGLPTIGETL